MADKFISVEAAKKALIAGLKLSREDEKRVCRILDGLQHIESKEKTHDVRNG